VTTWICIAGVYGVMSVVTLVAYGIDKRRAVRGKWRVPESRLHGLELLGGWPGALVGQMMFRHKRRKMTYMIAFCGIVLLHVAAWTGIYMAGWLG
jgi:uncharacterized membrane protein YsdA (DUF1294 family)